MNIEWLVDQRMFFGSVIQEVVGMRFGAKQMTSCNCNAREPGHEIGRGGGGPFYLHNLDRLLKYSQR